MLLNELLSKGFWTLLTKSSGAALTLVQTLVFARGLGAENFGLFSLAVTIVTILAIITRCGLDQVLLKQVASFFPESADKAKGYVFSAGLAVFLFSLFLGLLVWDQADNLSLYVFHKTDLSAVLTLCAGVIMPMSLGFVFTEAYKGTGHIVLVTCLQNVIAPLCTLALALILWQYGLFNLYYAVLSFISGKYIALLMTIFLWPWLFPRGAFEHISIIKVLKQGWPMLLVTSGALVMNWSDVIILGIYVAESDIGVYSVAAKIVLATQLLLMAMNSITAPKFARFHKESNVQGIADLAQMSTLLLIVLVSLPSVVLLGFPAWAMGLFGAEYRDGADLLVILAIGQFVNVACGSVGYLLTMTGNEKKMRDIMLLSAAVNLVLSVSLVQSYGSLGVACATAFSTILWNVWAMIEVKTRLGFWTLSLRVILK